MKGDEAEIAGLREANHHYRDCAAQDTATIEQYRADQQRDEKLINELRARSGVLTASDALLAAQECIYRETSRCIRLEMAIRDSIESLERNSTSAPVVECLKAALASSVPSAQQTGVQTEVLDREEKYLLDHFDAECGIMSGDVQGSFHRIRAALASQTEALRAIYEWYDRDGSVGEADTVFESHRAALELPSADRGRK